MITVIETDSKLKHQPSICKKIAHLDEDAGSHDSDSTCEDKQNGQAESRSKLKVQLCRNFLSNKICPYKYRCKFAHGLEQLLQNSQLGQNFRTKKCKIFYDKKHCRFGQRCNFRHCEPQKQLRVLTKSPILIQQYPQCFVGIRNKSKIIEMLNLKAISHQIFIEM